MDIGVISVRYARALLKSALEQQVSQQVYAEMQTVAQAFLEVPQLRSTIDNPMLAKSTKEQLLVTALGNTPSALSKAFVALVIREGRESMMLFIAHSYITLYRKEKNIIRGKLTTAARVSDATEQKMRQMVAHKTNGTVEFETEVDPEIIGGFILEYDTFRMDASVKSKLAIILTELKK